MYTCMHVSMYTYMILWDYWNCIAQRTIENVETRGREERRKRIKGEKHDPALRIPKLSNQRKLIQPSKSEEKSKRVIRKKLGWNTEWKEGKMRIFLKKKNETSGKYKRLVGIQIMV